MLSETRWNACYELEINIFTNRRREMSTRKFKKPIVIMALILIAAMVLGTIASALF